MTDNLDQRALNQLTEEERQLLAEDSTLLEDALTPESETVQARAARDEREEPDPESELRRDPTPAFDVHVPADAEQRLADLSQARADVVRMFEDGEITAREYSDGLERISDRREDIKTRQRMASAAKESHERVTIGNWEREVEKFMTTTAKDITSKGEGALLAFDSYVKKVTSDPANAKLSDRAQLAKAHRLFEADFGGSFGRDTSSVSGGSDFAAIDRLQGLAYERAVAKMTPAEREAYGID